MCPPNESGAARTHHKPAARIPEKRINPRKRDAERICLRPEIRLIYPLLEPRFRQWWEKEDADGVAKLDTTRMELSSKGETWGETVQKDSRD